MTLGAGARGLNLQGADHVIVMEPDWNPAVIEQAIKRAHRTGQRRTVTVYRLLLDHIVEHRILERSTQKIRLRDAIGTGAVGSEAPTDLRAFVQELGGFVQRSNAASCATAMNELDRRRVLDTARGALCEDLETAMTASHEARSDKVTALLAPGSAVMEALSAVESVPATAQELEGLQSTYDCLFKMTKIAAG